MRSIVAAISAAEKASVLRVRLGADGVRELASAAGYDATVSAELLDEDGEICGRAVRRPDPASGRYGPGLSWHVQLGGVISSRKWAAVPMGCGCGETASEAVRAAIMDLRKRASALASAADNFASFF